MSAGAFSLYIPHKGGRGFKKNRTADYNYISGVINGFNSYGFNLINSP